METSFKLAERSSNLGRLNPWKMCSRNSKFLGIWIVYIRIKRGPPVQLCEWSKHNGFNSSGLSSLFHTGFVIRSCIHGAQGTKEVFFFLQHHLNRNTQHSQKKNPENFVPLSIFLLPASCAKMWNENAWKVPERWNLRAISLLYCVLPRICLPLRCLCQLLILCFVWKDHSSYRLPSHRNTAKSRRNNVD